MVFLDTSLLQFYYVFRHNDADRWLDGNSISALATDLVAAVSKRSVGKRTVQEALANLQWVWDIEGQLSVQVLRDFWWLWDLLDGFHLMPGVPGQHSWTLKASGVYSSKSAYNAFFMGAVLFEPADRIWHSWAPPRCKFFMWLAAWNRCWTADRLAHKGLDHLELCSLCDQEEENINHLLVNCVFARSVWFAVLSSVNLHSLAPDFQDYKLQDWWSRAEKRVQKQHKKGFNSLVILVAWCIWKHSNACIFYGTPPSVPTCLQLIKEEAAIWCKAGAAGLRVFWPH
jgi:hypothetical protein